jgi:tRNA A37 threonylcarbamoyltransferase TsaD
MKDIQELTILNDDTHFEQEEGKYIGLGSIFNRVLRSLDILREDQSPQQIPEVLAALDHQYVDDIVDEFRILYIPKNIFDLDMYDYYRACHTKMMQMKSKYDAAKIFFSFQRSLFDILTEKFTQISDMTNVSEIAVV